MSVLYLVVSGAEPATGTVQYATDLVSRGWDTCVISTPDGTRFFDVAAAESVTGHPVRTAFKDPSAADVLPPADVMVIAPATFNLVNKLAAGISDTLALALANEAIGRGLPVLIVPWANVALRRHPAFPRSVELLRSADGVRFALGEDARGGEPGTPYPWPDILREIDGLAPRQDRS